MAGYRAFVIANDGTRLMPTTNPKFVRHVLKEGLAHVISTNPFTIQLDYETKAKETQPIEICEDTGAEHIGLSVKSEKHEYVSEQRDLLPNEKERHDHRRKYRRGRRNRKRYRKPRFSNRKKRKKKGWFAPSVKNKADVQINMIRRYIKVCPITSVIIECGQFDTQLLAAMEEGAEKPEGKDYQQGPTYGYETLREAVFARDDYTCIVCGRCGYPKDGKPAAILQVHHLGFRTGDHSNRMSNLATICTKCHTPANHKPKGKLYNLKPRLKTRKGASFMNTVKWCIYQTLAKEFPDIVHITYGAKTKRSRKDLGIEKSHANDAYCMGDLHPKDRANTEYYQKVRRHNRVLSKFYDAKYIDSRDGSTKKGAELPSGRTNRNHKRDTENLHRYRKTKVSKGRTVIRIGGGVFQPGDMVCYKGRNYYVVGMKNGNKAVQLKSGDRTANPSVNSVKLVHHSDGWRRTKNA